MQQDHQRDKFSIVNFEARSGLLKHACKIGAILVAALVFHWSSESKTCKTVHHTGKSGIRHPKRIDVEQANVIHEGSGYYR